MSPLLYAVIIPFILGLLCFIIPKKVKGVRETLALLGTAGIFGLSIWMFSKIPMEWTYSGVLFLKLDYLSGISVLAGAFFSLLIAIYSLKYMKDTANPGRYYASLLWTLGATAGALMANHLLLLLVFWGFLGLTLYLLILSGGDEAAGAAKKSLVIIGGTDALILLGIVLLYSVTSTYELHLMELSFNSVTVYFAYFLIILGAFAKAGCMPLHTWIPDVAEHAPIPVTAYLPASLDKILGIYLLVRLSVDVMTMNYSVNLILMIIGAITILAGVMMALVQHDMKKLLAYHAVSQVGYMVLGIGTGMVIGIIGGLFHMFNNTLYKTSLFLSAGSVKQQTGTTDLNKLGGLAKFMPWTFLSFLIATVAISGLPPFNGFISKWLIYQGLVELGKSGDKLWIIWLFAAMFGSGLTLASFMKLMHAVFLGNRSSDIQKKTIKESGFTIVFPMAVLAFLCVIFGIFAEQLPLKMFLIPIVGPFDYLGFWSAGPATLMIIGGLVLGLIIYLFGNLKNIRTEDSFIGGEKLPADTRVTGTGFYNTIKDIALFKKMYRMAEKKWFDIYDIGSKWSYSIGGVLRKAHTGLLNLYLLWVFVGLLVLLILLMGR